MKGKVYSIDGSIIEEIDLPKIFEFEYRPDLIKKAFLVMRANRRQPYGASQQLEKIMWQKVSGQAAVWLECRV